MRLLIISVLISLSVFTHSQDVNIAKVIFYDDSDGTSCGVSPDKYDTPYIVALNLDGPYDGGKACGRFIKAYLVHTI